MAKIQKLQKVGLKQWREQMRKTNRLLLGLLGLGMMMLSTMATAQWQRGISLENADASFVGEQFNDYTGWSVTGIGDVNGDGFNEFLVGALNYGNGGQVYLLLGKLSGWEREVSLANADASFLPLYGQRIGSALAGIGDANGDGFDDFLIGAPTSISGFGQAYLFLGKASGWDRAISVSEADASFVGEYAGDLTGGSVAVAGDVNGDDYDDFLIGAPGWPQNAETGIAYLILGREEGWSQDTSVTTIDASFRGEYFSFTGGALAGVGDTNGDGYDDFVVSAPKHHGDFITTNAGKVYLVHGKPDGWDSHEIFLESHSDASFSGENNDDFAGSAISGAGDVNGDGFDDFLIGAPGNGMPDSTKPGRTYLILGRSSGWTNNVSLAAADASFWGEHEGDWSGSSLAGVQDVNEDGYDEFLIGARGSDAQGINSGQVYFVRGQPTGWEVAIPLSEIGVSYVGEKAGDMAGRSVAGLGDVNGDGPSDMLVSATFFGQDPSYEIGGIVYLIFGERRMHIYLPIVYE